MAIRRLWRDEAGGALVEATVLIPILFVFLLGSVDFLYAFYQWTAATKAIRSGPSRGGVGPGRDRSYRHHQYCQIRRQWHHGVYRRPDARLPGDM